MKIEIKKTTNFHCEYAITRDNQPAELITLEAKTYLVHDICHYVVEKNLAYTNGLWGMLSQGHTFKDLLGKNNPQTTELRLIEQIVGPVQSVFLKNIPKEDFEIYTKHIGLQITENQLNTCLAEIESIFKSWEQLAVGQRIMLDWNL